MSTVDLVLEGGSVKCLAYAAALQEFEKCGFKYDRVIGTSAGAIVAVAIACGFTASEIHDIMDEKTAEGKPVFQTFLDVPRKQCFSQEQVQSSTLFKLFEAIDIPFVPEYYEQTIDNYVFEKLQDYEYFRMLFSLEECGGLYEGRVFRKWFIEKLHKKGFTSRTSFSELYKVSGVDLSVIAVDVDTKRKLVLNHRTSPDVPVSWATRASMSIPFLWQEVVWKSHWGKYLDQDLTGHSLVDGGVVSNFALDLLLEPADPLVERVMGSHASRETTFLKGNRSTDGVNRVIGLLMDEELPVPGVEDKEESCLMGQVQSFQRLTRLIDTMREATDKAHIRLYADYVCRLPCKGYGTTEFDLSDEKKEALMKAATEATVAFLAK